MSGSSRPATARPTTSRTRSGSRRWRARAGGPPIVAVPCGDRRARALPLAAGRRGARRLLVGRVPRRRRDRARGGRPPVRRDHRAAPTRRSPPRPTRRVLQHVASQRAVTHTQALAGAYGAGLALWAAVTGDARARRAARHGAARPPRARSPRPRRGPRSSAAARRRAARRGVVVGGGAGVGGGARAGADAQGDLAHPRRGRRDARGRDVGDVRARARAPDGLARPGGRPAGRRGAAAVRRRPARRTLRLPGGGDGDARLRRSPRCPAAAALSAGARASRPATTSTSRPGPTPTTRPRGAPHERPARRRRLRQRLLDAVHEPDRAARAARAASTSSPSTTPTRRSAARAAERLDLEPRAARRRRRVCTHPDVDVVLVLTSMPEHGRLARAALEAGKHVLVEKPVATTLEEAAGGARGRRARARASCSARRTSCSRPPTGRCTRACATATIGGLLTARGRYGWAGPDWSRWFYEPGGGALFDLGVYNVTSLCGFFGPGAARDGDDRRRDPGARGQRRADARARPRTTRTC